MGQAPIKKAAFERGLRKETNVNEEKVSHLDYPIPLANAERKIDQCMNCGQSREIAAFGLCFTCYRRQERAKDRPFVDKHNPGVNPTQKKILAGFAKLMGGLGDIGVPRGLVILIRRMISPYLVPVENLLSPPPPGPDTDAFPAETEIEPVNSEHISKTVHRSQDESLNGKPKRGVK
jgi:hypothetical protein